MRKVEGLWKLPGCSIGRPIKLDQLLVTTEESKLKPMNPKTIITHKKSSLMNLQKTSKTFKFENLKPLIITNYPRKMVQGNKKIP